MNAAARLQAALYAPTSTELTQPLPAIADVVQERLEAIYAAPLVTDVDALLRELGGLTAILMRVRLALVREAESREPDRQAEEAAPMNDEARLVLLWKLVRTASKDRRLSRVDLACLMGVLDRFNPANVDDQGRMVAWPGLKSIANGAHADRSSAVRSMGRLVLTGYLDRETRELRQTNVYRIGPQGSGVDAPSGVAAPRRKRATTGRRADATTVGAAPPLQVGAALHPEPALKNLPKEPTQSNLPNLVISASRFPEFYRVYPRKVDPKDAERAVLRGKLDPLADQIIADVVARIADPGQWAERKFIPHPATYLNKQRWLEEWTPSTKTRGALLPRDSRTDIELEQANRDQLARFGMEAA